MISVIIPSHNRYQNLKIVIEAVYFHKIVPFELILVDDFSDDNTSELVSTYKEKNNFKYLRLTKKDTWNASRPRNYGAKIAEGEVFLFLDSDIILNPEALKFYWGDYLRNKERVVIGRYDWLPPLRMDLIDLNTIITQKWKKLLRMDVRDNLGHIGDDIRLPSFKKAKSPDMLFNTVYDGLACFGGNLLIPRDIFFKAGGYDENMRYGVEDGDFGITLWEMGVKFSYDERCIGYHLWHPISSERSAKAGIEVKKLNKKHKMDVVYASAKAYRRWGIDWKPSPEWYDYDEEKWNKIKEKIKNES